MANFYGDMQNVAKSLIGEFQQGTIELITATPGTGPADDPGPATEIATVVPGVARGAKFKYVDGKNILASDMQVTIPAGGVVPDPKGFVRGDGVRYKIVRVDVIPPFGTPVAYRVFFRK